MWFSNLSDRLMSWVFPERLLKCECQRTHCCYSNYGSGNGLMPSGNKPLHEHVLTQIYGHNVLFLSRSSDYTPPPPPPPPHTTKLLGGILVSLPPSICPFVCLSVRPASHVRSVVPTVLVGSISYLYILSSNFRKCAVCKVSCKISKFEFLAIFLNL